MKTEKLAQLERAISFAKAQHKRAPTRPNDKRVRDAIRALLHAKRSTPEPLRDLTRAELAELVAFATEHGAHWRQALRNQWSVGARPRSILYALSVSHGVSWLYAFRFPHEVGRIARPGARRKAVRFGGR